MSERPDRLQYRFGAAIAGANLVGAIIVFVFLYFVLAHPGVHHAATAQLLNAIAFGALGVIGFPAIWAWNARRWRATSAGGRRGARPATASGA